MVQTESFITKMYNIKEQADKSKGKQRQQLLKCYHRMLKELAQCYCFQSKDIEHIKILKND